MLVPKATIYKHDYPTSSKDNIRIAWEILPMQPEAEAHLVDQFSNQYFRLGTLAGYASHNCRTLLSGDSIHDAIPQTGSSKVYTCAVDLPEHFTSDPSDASL